MHSRTRSQKRARNAPSVLYCASCSSSPLLHIGTPPYSFPTTNRWCRSAPPDCIVQRSPTRTSTARSRPCASFYKLIISPTHSLGLAGRRGSGAYGFGAESPLKAGARASPDEYGFPADDDDTPTSPAPAPASVPKWETAVAPNGKTYWFNRATGDSRWTDPHKKAAAKPTPGE